ncbi:mitochondrial F1-F0 ATP synthase subunit F of fungi-domain-containing protein [Pterulicium gracile]|uniref:Mitochondrial F1-F0 ATP synthase subunit F of fungi-domain-containing protein n=1 Tax=Pterulicium gracile TaxID=1884261 RepID=A0A5C3QJ80_9AGAR|nr:mitochondrial F1-F0 ATP synthase subunit F of fungi-domain-containing protein [Pterula gracilis]
MHASVARRQLGNIVPPKIASPSILGGGSSGGALTPLVQFYSKLPKGKPTARAGGLKGKFFNRGNESGLPLVATIFGIFAMGYTIDYHMHLKHHKNHAH